MMGAVRAVRTYPLSSMQQGMLLQSLHEGGAYVQQMICELRELVDEPHLKSAWQSVIRENEILRSAFRWQDLLQPCQDVYAEVEVPWKRQDLTNLRLDQRDEKFEAFLQEDRKRSFDVTKPPLLRCSLFKFDENHYRLVWTFHHALLDGRSHFFVLKEVFARYTALLNAEAIATDGRRPYGDYIEWLQSRDWSQATAFWREYLRGFTPPPDLELSESALTGSTSRDRASESLSLSAQATESLKNVAEKTGVTLNTLVQASWAILLSRYYCSDDVVFGATRACRHSTIAGSAEMIGLFINTLPLRVRVNPQQDVHEWLHDLRRQQIAFRDFEHTPLPLIQAQSDAPAGKSLFETVLVFENYSINEQLNGNGRRFELLEQTHYPLTFAAYSGEQLLLKIEYDQRRFDGSTVRSMLSHVANLLQNLTNVLRDASSSEKKISNSSCKIGELSLLSERERQRLLLDWNRIAEFPRSGKCLHELFSEQVRRAPDAIAIVHEDKRLTYAELDERAANLARRLQTRGVGPEVLVPLCVERSLNMVVGIIGILKAGGAYLPLDPSYPDERLAFMLADSGARILVTDKASANRLSKVHTWQLNDLDVLRIDGEPEHSSQAERVRISASCSLAAAISPLNLAYTTYTSGSTGQPKGVMVTHENVVRLFEATQSLFGFDQGDVWTLFHSYAFDFSVWELWGALLYGGLLVIIPYWISRTPKKFRELVEAAGVTVLNQTPSAFRQFVEAGHNNSNSLQRIIFGGEALDANAVNRWFDNNRDGGPRLINMYGITETTVHVTYHQLERGCTGKSGKTPIGRPLGDLQVYILDERMQPLPAGVPGEMFVGGAGLTRGYLNRPDLTADRFVPHPFADRPGERLYRTGDVARFGKNGELEYVGRCDRQVKIRGFRIELGEIEQALNNHPAIRDCVAMVREDQPNTKTLVAYIVLRAPEITTAELRSFLGKTLPDHMVPAVFVRLEELPLTENGKIDRRALPPPAGEAAIEKLVAPRNATEEILSGIWREVLGLKNVGIYDDFFELGGDSLRATQVVARAGTVFQIDLPLGALFNDRTVAALAETVEDILVEELSQRSEDEAARASGD